MYMGLCVISYHIIYQSYHIISYISYHILYHIAASVNDVRQCKHQIMDFYGNLRYELKVFNELETRADHSQSKKLHMCPLTCNSIQNKFKFYFKNVPDVDALVQANRYRVQEANTQHDCINCIAILNFICTIKKSDIKYCFEFRDKTLLIYLISRGISRVYLKNSIL